MLIKLTGGRVYDPTHQIDGKVMDIYIRDGRIVESTRAAMPCWAATISCCAC